MTDWLMHVVFQDFDPFITSIIEKIFVKIITETNTAEDKIN